MKCSICDSESIKKHGRDWCPVCELFFDRNKSRKSLGAASRPRRPAVKIAHEDPGEQSGSSHSLFMAVIRTSIITIVLAALVLGAAKPFFYIDAKSGCFIKILPSWLEFSNGNIQRAIKTLKHASPEDYSDLCVNVETIDPSVSCGGWEGGCYHSSKARRIYVSTSQRSLAWTVGVLVHETCHAIQHRESRGFDEQECYKADDRILREIIEF